MHTEQGKAFALQKLAERRQTKPEHVDNGRLPAGSPMYFYCLICSHLADTLPESFIGRPAQLCKECQALKTAGWLE